MIHADTVKVDLVMRDGAVACPLRTTKRSLFRYFKTSPEIIRLAVLMCIRFPLSLRNIEDVAARTRHRHQP